MNGVIYCRVSSKEQVEGTSLESQEIACREYATRNQISVAKVFVERGESAKFADRTQLLELMEFCHHRENRVEALLVWKVDRLARNVGDHFHLKARLLKQEVRVISVTEPIDSNPEGKLLETILAGFAQFDNDLRAARTLQGMRRKIKEGIFPWKPPLGYRTITQPGSKKTEPDQPEQPAFGLLQRAWSEFATGAYTKAEVLRQMTHWGLRTRSGERISKQTLDNIFSDQFYAGIIRDPWSGEELMGRHLPMVSRETYAKVREIISRRNRSIAHHSVRAEFPLRVFARCGRCEHYVTGAFSRGRSRYYPYYRCFSKNCLDPGNYNTDCVHREFVSFLDSTSPKQSAIERIKEYVARVATRQAETSRALGERRKTNIKRIEEQQQQLIRMRMDRLITDAEFLAQRSVIAKTLAELEATGPDNAAKPEAVLSEIDEMCDQLKNLSETWQTIPPEFKQRFQRLALPVGFVVGRVRTAQTGHFFSLLRHSPSPKTTLVAPEGQSWHQLAEEIKMLAALLRGTHDQELKA
jgi:site-specific DNA recombinase